MTETGVGGADAGCPARAAGEALRGAVPRPGPALLERWDADPRVDAAFQYTFREDDGLPRWASSTPALTRTYPTYDLWLRWSRSAPEAPGPPAPPPGC